MVGIAGDSESRFYKDEGIVRTLTQFQVETVERGPLQVGDQITVSALGGQTPELTQVSEHQPTFTAGDKSRLFLTPNENLDGAYRVFGLDQGKQDANRIVTAASTGRDGFSSAAQCSQSYCLNGFSWPFTQLPAKYKVNPNAPGVSNELAAVQAAFNTWERADSRMDFHYLGTTSIAQVSADGTSVVFWHDATGEVCGGVTNYLACWHSQGYEFDIDFNSAFPWTTDTEDDPNDWDVQSVAVHEAGHALGLDHTTQTSQVMFGAIGEGVEKRALGSGDIAGVTFLYPGNEWNLRNSNTVGPPNLTFAFGSATDRVVLGDWNGDGLDTPGIYRPSTLQWHLNNGFDGTAETVCTWGSANDIPVAGDWNGDGVDSPGLFRPSTNTWFLNNACDSVAENNFAWGSSTDIPVPGNWDGIDGCLGAEVCWDTPGLFRPSTREWFLNGNFDGDLSDPGDKLPFVYGITGDLPVKGDWDHVDKCGLLSDCFDDTPGVFRAPNSWFLNNDFNGTSEVNFAFGRRGDIRAGDWNGDDVDTIGVR